MFAETTKGVNAAIEHDSPLRRSVGLFVQVIAGYVLPGHCLERPRVLKSGSAGQAVFLLCGTYVGSGVR